MGCGGANFGDLGASLDCGGANFGDLGASLGCGGANLLYWRARTTRVERVYHCGERIHLFTSAKYPGRARLILGGANPQHQKLRFPEDFGFLLEVL
ncbi:hypothetical protein SAMN05216225_10352 [Ornithinibacillus halophilus]|uniref:Uncharacterized protein n=1 Tax=Ornithinibacillus halophilus TaxID=930117 RepID=A0A1M5K2S5_9BACI|nr:hypothetical protein SAMN05216225_10352 [Ornithinibacillus halophilus]